MGRFSFGCQRINSRRALIASLAVLLLGGCAFRPSTEDDRLEHHASPHRPGSFPAAVEELDRRFPDLAAKQSLDVARDPSAAELADIVRWLPELAADSDLRRADWEAANRRAQELEKLLPGWLAAKPAEKQEAMTAIRSSLGELRQLADRSDDLVLPTGESTAPPPAIEPSSSAVPVQSAEK